jgi:hypothetical protein
MDPSKPFLVDNCRRSFKVYIFRTMTLEDLCQVDFAIWLVWVSPLRFPIMISKTIWTNVCGPVLQELCLRIQTIDPWRIYANSMCFPIHWLAMCPWLCRNCGNWLGLEWKTTILGGMLRMMRVPFRHWRMLGPTVEAVLRRYRANAARPAALRPAAIRNVGLPHCDACGFNLSCIQDWGRRLLITIE